MSGRKSGKSGKGICNQRTVFLGGIPLDSTKSELLAFLTNFDDVEYLEIAKEKSNTSCKGFAKAVLRTDPGVQRLLASHTHFIRGLEIGVRRWSKKSDYLREKDEVSRRKLFVKYHPSYTRDDLMLHFSMFGHLESIDIKTDPWTNKPRHFAYIIFKTEEEARTASVNSVIQDKSQYIHCELTTPSYLMQHDYNKTAMCASPTWKNPLSPTKQGSSPSFEPSAGFGPRVGSLNLDAYGHTSLKSLTDLGHFSSYRLDRYTQKKGSCQCLFNIREEPAPRKHATCSEFPTQQIPVAHGTKPTSKKYRWRRVASNHMSTNLRIFKNERVNIYFM